MPTKKASTIPKERLAQYEALVATNAEVQRKGAAVPYTSVNGHMFSYLKESGHMALKLPQGPREEFLDKYETKLCEAYGIVQKEYVMVPESLLANLEELKPYFDLSFESTRNLKPKPTKKKPQGP